MSNKLGRTTTRDRMDSNHDVIMQQVIIKKRIMRSTTDSFELDPKDQAGPVDFELFTS